MIDWRSTRRRARRSKLVPIEPRAALGLGPLMHEDRPWLRFYGKVPATLAYPEVTLYEARAARRAEDR
ncbi:MAG TPA: hypothetical protein VLA30_06290 [Burkholderiales bacterium]|nr:hypothetical protein [Burkholderiales bacterium]